jgi:hypothetical protein
MSHVLAAMAPAQAATGDVDGGRQMAAASLTVARNTADVVAVLAATSAWAPAGEDAEEAGAWVDRKRGQWAAAVAAAAADAGEHAAVLAAAERGVGGA